jgi:cytoskeleton protein RodZ
MATSFGEQLRLAREARGITLREISEQTRISTRYLEAIEADDYKRLPGGIFNKSFIKAYAKYIGFDEQEALEAYTRTARDQGSSPDDVTSTPYQPRVYTDDTTRSPFVTILLTILILAIISLGVWGALHWYQRRTAAPTPTPAPAPQPNTQSATGNNLQTTSNAQAPTTSTATSGLNVQVRARSERVWIKTRTDEQDATEKTLEPGEALELKPAQRLSILFSPSKTSALEMLINGRPAKVVPDSKGALAEFLITKENYEQFLQ